MYDVDNKCVYLSDVPAAVRSAFSTSGYILFSQFAELDVKLTVFFAIAPSRHDTLVGAHGGFQVSFPYSFHCLAFLDGELVLSAIACTFASSVAAFLHLFSHKGAEFASEIATLVLLATSVAIQPHFERDIDSTEFSDAEIADLSRALKTPQPVMRGMVARAAREAKTQLDAHKAKMSADAGSRSSEAPASGVQSDAETLPPNLPAMFLGRPVNC